MVVAVVLKEITKDNWREAVRLKVDADQTGFVASNAFSLAQSKFEPHWIAQGIYVDETMVGFLMHGFDEIGDEFDGYWICRLMIDQRYQKKGYGREAMRQVLQDIKESGHTGPIHISFEPHNTVAAQLYLSLGFHDTGKETDGENVYVIDASEI